jgi:uncharacterized protein (TIGR00725 family)
VGVYQICVSGAAKGNSVEQSQTLAMEIGAALAAAGHSLMTGATTGLPDFAAIGYKKARGHSSIGLSPASTKVEHILKYRLPIEEYDAILYTGLHYVGRDTMLITSSDAVISIGGRLGTLHEFTIAMETKTPIAFLENSGGVGDKIQEIMQILPNADPDLAIFDADPVKLVDKLTRYLDKLNEPYKHIYQSVKK